MNEDLELDATPTTPDGLAAIRRRGVFVAGALLWAAAGGFLVVVAGGLVLAAERGLALVERLRPAVGLRPPAAGPDWLLMGLLAAGLVALLVLLLLLWRGYRRAWERRLAAVWEHRRDRRRYARFEPLPERATPEVRAQRAAYLEALLASPAWQGTREPLRRKLAPAPAAGEPPAERPDGRYERHAAAVLAEVESDVAERAITTGLVVGLSPSRVLDAATILLAAFEIQLHVLARLGKKPSLRMWRELLKRCGASLFVNTYLHREDALLVSFAIKKTSLGLQAASELLEGGAELVADLDTEEIVDTLLGEGMVPDRLQPFVAASVLSAGLSLGVGSTGLRLIGQAIEKIGDELLQGVLAGSILYFHGIALAADCLALDAAHRASPAMSRSFMDCVRGVAATAGKILRGQIQARRQAFRERRKSALRHSGKVAGGVLKKALGVTRKAEAGLGKSGA